MTIYLKTFFGSNSFKGIAPALYSKASQIADCLKGMRLLDTLDNPDWVRGHVGSNGNINHQEL